MFKGAQYFKNDIEKHIETSFTIIAMRIFA